MTFVTQWASANDTLFRQQVEMAMCQAGINIGSEATTTANHALRIALSVAVLNNPDGYVDRFAKAAAAAIPADTLPQTDAAISTAIASVWNDIAGQALPA